MINISLNIISLQHVLANVYSSVEMFSCTGGGNALNYLGLTNRAPPHTMAPPSKQMYTMQPDQKCSFGTDFQRGIKMKSIKSMAHY